DEEREMEDELAEPLAELRQSLRRLEVVEADQVDEQEEPEEGDHEAGRARQAPGPVVQPPPRVSGQEEDREDLGEADLPGDVPVELLEAHREHGREEEHVREAARGHQATPCSSSASSPTRARREIRSRRPGSSGRPSRAPARQRDSRPTSASRIAPASSGGTTMPAFASRIRRAAAPSGATAARIGRSAARDSKIFAGSTGPTLSPGARSGPSSPSWSWRLGITVMPAFGS